ncbi:ankyrin repeat domain-containing protein 7-like [Antechinus flavipes]|uniref:ankyrin repeat domain-containing protein 7-like n=1 Tax=Antechinus flavipes TaxID=38775 RepID=UPI0022363D27|nr:ankyrin repeat domain-containing protein 7-like [Antechinus flavipes]
MRVQFSQCCIWIQHQQGEDFSISDTRDFQTSHHKNTKEDLEVQQKRAVEPGYGSLATAPGPSARISPGTDPSISKVGPLTFPAVQEAQGYQRGFGRTPLHLACAKGYPDIVSLLVERKCKVDLQDKDSLTPLIKAVLCHQEECAIILLKHGANPNLGDHNNNTALHYAAFDQNVAMVEKLLTYKADIEAKNKEGFTPFMFAVMKRSYELVELLLKMGANVNATDNTKRTSLMIAISMESMGIVNLLFQNNVDPTCEDEDGWTAEKYAKHFRYPLGGRKGEGGRKDLPDEMTEITPHPPQISSVWAAFSTLTV